MPWHYLLPEETGKTKCASAVATQTEQAEKHGKSQEEINGEHHDEGKFIVLHVRRGAGARYV
jgi:hypothetical protein